MCLWGGVGCARFECISKAEHLLFVGLTKQNAKLIVFCFFFSTQPFCCWRAIPEFIALISRGWDFFFFSSLLPGVEC